ncbi:hypothetical protein FAZ79_00505 [Guyparkeria sp. SB14A]|uniref:hypothetical protein n=1 Tax=Guyparkeria sp. SB14A TaxID=2571147 RepID=UPI0010ABB7CA|nr:hypothetical protein [Guyparkeria sp. SB14A]TKA91820.1 hypothetical protein FAZ79_00505 [Guyparkeria sp. SB14A]
MKRALLGVGILAAMVVLLWAAYSLGQSAGENATRADWSEERARLAQQHVDGLKRALDQQAEWQAENQAIAIAWAKQQQQIEDDYGDLQERAAAEAPDRAECRPTRGAVRLLNDAARAGPGGDELPRAPRLTPDEARAPADLAEPAVWGHCIGWAARYATLAARFNRLIDWHEATDEQQ